MKAFFDAEGKLDGLIKNVEDSVAALKAYVYGEQVTLAGLHQQPQVTLVNLPSFAIASPSPNAASGPAGVIPAPDA